LGPVRDENHGSKLPSVKRGHYSSERSPVLDVSKIYKPLYPEESPDKPKLLSKAIYGKKNKYRAISLNKGTSGPSRLDYGVHGIKL